jgi:hypothetical protein
MNGYNAGTAAAVQLAQRTVGSRCCTYWCLSAWCLSCSSTHGTAGSAAPLLDFSATHYTAALCYAKQLHKQHRKRQLLQESGNVPALLCPCVHSLPQCLLRCSACCSKRCSQARQGPAALQPRPLRHGWQRDCLKAGGVARAAATQHHCRAFTAATGCCTLLHCPRCSQGRCAAAVMH